MIRSLSTLLFITTSVFSADGYAQTGQDSTVGEHFNATPLTSKQIIGADSMVLISTLSAHDVMRGPAGAVGYLRVTKLNELHVGCTLFLVAEDKAMTNWHCVAINDKHLAASRDMKTWFDYVQDDEKGELGPRVEKILVADKTLDFALLQLSEPIGKTRGFLQLDLDATKNAKAVVVIQHANDKAKRIARQDNAIINHSEPLLHYTADTMIGAAGSPVLTPDGASLIAIHHAGGAQKNEGITMSAIYPLVKEYVSVKAPCSTASENNEASSKWVNKCWPWPVTP